uniref:Nucleotide exchange factor GrpE n=1 Tax=Globodera pallida TaxID=36090 RepID=A0A183CH52_GLOPA
MGSEIEHNGADAIRQYHEELEERARDESARAIAEKDRQNEVIVEQLEELEEFANNSDLMVVKVLDVVAKDVRNGLEEEEEETEDGGIRIGEDFVNVRFVTVRLVTDHFVTEF